MKKITLLTLTLCLLSGISFAYTAADLTNPDPAVRMKAAQELGNNRVKGAVPGLIEALKDPSEGVRINAVVALGYLQDDTSLDPIIALINRDKSKAVRVMATQALGKFKNDKAVNFLEQASDDKDAKVRSAANRSLGKVGNERSIKKLLRKAKDDADPLARQNALEALLNLSETRKLDEQTKKDIENTIQSAEGDRDVKVKESAGEARKRFERMHKQSGNKKK